MMQTIRVVFISIPRDEANDMARQIVEGRYAACINVLPKTESYFWWEGNVEHDEEALLIVKTTEARFDDLVEFVRDNHPYEVPEIISVPLAGGLEEYVNWIHEELDRE